MYGSFIRAVRASRGLTQVELARTIGIEQPNLSAYENDRQMPSADVLHRILRGCGFLLEATAGERRIVCPLPGVDRPSDGVVRPGRRAAPVADRIGGPVPWRDDERSAAILEQVLDLADAIRWSKAGS
jgi:transcriptional regulator with XRE-family HTH domain